MKPVPFWTDDFPRPDALVASGLPDESGVLVVGAGVTGLAAARRLARSGAAVTVLDAGSAGAGASTISGGMVICGLKAGTRRTMRSFGEKLGREMVQASLDCVDLVEKVIAEEGIACDWRRDGSAQLGFTEHDCRTFLADADHTQRVVGLRSRILDGPDIRTIVASDRFSVAEAEDLSGGLHPAKFTYGLAGAAVKAGATLVEHVKALGVARDGRKYVVRTSVGTIRVDEVLVATNGYTDERLVPRFRRGIVPIGSYIVVTEALPEAVRREVIPGNRMLWTARRFLNYFRLTPDGRMLMGGRQNLSTDLDLTRSASVLGDRIVEFFPQLASFGVTHSWSGNLGATFDLQPHIVRFDGVWCVGGYSGHGMGLGTYLGDAVAGLIIGEAKRSPFAEIPFATRFYYRRKPWFLPAGAVLFRTLDRFGR